MAILDKIKTKFVNKRFLKLELLMLGILSIIACILYVSDVPPVMAQDGTAALPEVVMPQSGQRVLVFSPHPDDESIGVGGYIAQSIANGANVEIVLVTNGNFHGNEQERYAEFKKATQILGVPESNLVFLGFPDGKLDKMDPTVLSVALQSQIEQFNPDIIIYPDAQDMNPDHWTIGKAVQKILAADPQQITSYEYLVHFKLIWPRPRELAPNLGLSPPERLINADTTWEKVPLSQNIENIKSEAIHTYRSQLENEWLHGLLLSSIRKNELLAIPKNLYTQ
ncbi:MAG: PIG-L family deacetylase [Dehalococcoidales bacterium]|jgi:LmbE family N-acetylglucosaminyl deacetylase